MINLWVLFNTIALSKEDSSILIRNLGITKKQYYSRLSALLRAGLVKRNRGSILLLDLVEYSIMLKK
jgi:hypothetical protein